MYAFNTQDQLAGYAFASGGSDNGYNETVMKYYDLSSLTEVWSTQVYDVSYSANSIDFAGDLFDDGSSVIVVGISSRVLYYSAR